MFLFLVCQIYNYYLSWFQPKLMNQKMIHFNFKFIAMGKSTPILRLYHKMSGFQFKDKVY